MVITYRAYLRPPYIGYQSAQVDPDLRFVLVPNSGKRQGFQQKNLETREPS